jgi:hypothetical protein
VNSHLPAGNRNKTWSKHAEKNRGIASSGKKGTTPVA